MADDADRAQELIEREREEVLRKHRERPKALFTHCQDPLCSEPLSPERQEYGWCIHCAKLREMREKMRGRG